MPTWPAVVDTTGMDNDTDSLPRVSILDLTTKFNDIIALRGVAGGVCDLDGSGVIPVARIPAAIARLASPALSGTPTAPTAALGTNTTQLATTAFALANGLLNGTLAKAAAYTIAAADRGKLLDFTSAGVDLTLDVVVGTAFFGAVRNSAVSGSVTLKSTAAIDGVAGATGIAIGPGESCFFGYDGTAWKTVGRATTPTYKAKVSANDTTPGYLNGKLVAGANITLTEGSDGGNETLTIAATGVSSDVGVSGIGMMAFLYNNTTNIAPGATVSGASLLGNSVAMTGTWRNIENTTVVSYVSGNFQRIA